MEVVPKVDDVTSTALILPDGGGMEPQGGLDSESIINAHQNTWRVYRWQTNGTKALKRDDGTQIWRIHYRCSSWNKPETATGCKARFSEDFLTKDKRNSLGPKKFRPIQHNHPPPTRTTLDQDIIDEIGNQARQGRKSSAIEKSILSATPAEDLTKSYRLPSRKQIQNEIQKVRNAESGYAQTDTIKHVCAQAEKIVFRYGKTADIFLHHYTVFPEVRIVMASAKGLELITQHGQLSIIDSSFDLADLGLALITILVYDAGVLVPAVFFLTNVVSTANLEWFLRFIQNLLLGQWGLTWCFVDCEPALRSAINSIAPVVVTLTDSCHFFDENHKWLRTNNSLEWAEPVDQSLHILWSAPTAHEFNTALAGFMNYWNTALPNYAVYFQKTWVETCQAAEWAWYNRSELPLLDLQIRSFEERLMVAGLRGRSNLETAVTDLYVEWLGFQKLYQNPELLAERLKEIEAHQNKQPKYPSMHDWITNRNMIPTIPAYAGTTDPSDPQYQPTDTLATDHTTYAEHHAHAHHLQHVPQLPVPQHPQHVQHVQQQHVQQPQQHGAVLHPVHQNQQHTIDPLAPPPYNILYPTGATAGTVPAQAQTAHSQASPPSPAPITTSNNVEMSEPVPSPTKSPKQTNQLDLNQTQPQPDAPPSPSATTAPTPPSPDTHPPPQM